MVNQVIGQLQTVIDPELLVNVVDLGLIYGVDIDDEGNCLVTMTLTTAGCPLNDYLNREIRQAVSQLAAIRPDDGAPAGAHPRTNCLRKRQPTRRRLPSGMTRSGILPASWAAMKPKTTKSWWKSSRRRKKPGRP